MADTARTFDSPPDAGPTRPALEVVREALPEDAEHGGPRTWRNAAVGAALGFVIAATVITVVGTLAGIGFGGALGLGVFVGAFGGVGFGFMMGGMASFARELDGQPVDVTARSI